MSYTEFIMTIALLEELQREIELFLLLDPDPLRYIVNYLENL